MRRIHLLSAVVGRRNNWLLSPGKFPDQFLFMIDKNKKLFSSTEQEHRQEEKKTKKKRGEEERGLGKQNASEGRRKVEAASRGQREAGVSPDETDAWSVCLPVHQRVLKQIKHDEGLLSVRAQSTRLSNSIITDRTIATRQKTSKLASNQLIFV